MSKVIISPSILSADFANLQRDVEIVERAGADWLHVDVMDGHFVPNISIGVPVVKSLKKVTKIPLDVHLMIENPMKYIPAFIDAGADIVTVHYEACIDNLKDIISYVRSKNCKIGVSIKPATNPNVLCDYLKLIDLVLVMTVEPGFGGQKFMPDAAKKVEYIRSLAPEGLIIQVDGGINAQTGKICKDYGANSLVAGNYIYKSDDIANAISSLR